MSVSRFVRFSSSCLALCMVASAPWAGEAQAALIPQGPQSAFAAMGAMDTASTIETANVMNHLRTLRTSKTRTRSTAAAPAIHLDGVAQANPQAATKQAAPETVEDPIIIFDSPTNAKPQKTAPQATTDKTTKTKKTKKKGKTAHPALYLDDGEQESTNTTSWWDQNVVEPGKNGGSFLDAIGEFFGGPPSSADGRKDLPRTAAATSRDIAPKRAQANQNSYAAYPGQPLSAYNNAVTYGEGNPLPPKYAMVTVYGPSHQTNIKNVAPAGAKRRESNDVSGEFEWVSNAPRYGTAPAAVKSPVKAPKESMQGYIKDLTPPPSADAPHYGDTAVLVNEGETISADRRWGVFAAGDAVFGNQENAKGQGSTQTSAGGFSVGLDYRIQDQSFVGLALTYAHESFKINDAADVSGDSVSVSLYGTTKYMGHAYADGFLSLGFHGFDNDRTLMAGTPSAITGTASTDGLTFTAKAETGYTFTNNGFAFGPFAGMKILYASLDGYEETGLGSLNQTVEDTTRTSAITSLGLSGTRAFALGNGVTLAPTMRLSYNHEFGEGRTNIEGTTSGTAFKSKGVNRTRDWINIAPSITANLPDAWQLQASYDHDFFRKDVNENLFNMAAKYRW